MTSPVKGNFGHHKEKGVLLLTREDSNIKHQRNTLLAGYSMLALFTLGIGAVPIAQEADRESEIRCINVNHYPNLPYSKCVALRKVEKVVYNNQIFYNPYYADDLKEKEKQERLEQEERDNPTYESRGGETWGPIDS